MADVRMRWRKNGSVIAMIQIENQSEINNIMPIRDLGYIFNNYNEQIKEHQRENERNGKRFYARELGDDEHLLPPAFDPEDALLYQSKTNAPYPEATYSRRKR